VLEKVAEVPVITPMLDAPKVLEPPILVNPFPMTTGNAEVLLIFKSTPSLFIVLR
jgi:hypothetical protein